MPLLRRLALPALLAVATAVGVFTTAPAHAATTGTLGVHVTGRYTAGHTWPLTGALVTAENIDNGLQYPVAVYGDPATSAYYQALNLPFGRYRIRVEAFGFATMYWPQQYSRASSAAVVFGDAPGCNPADAAVCDVHMLTAEVPQLVTLSGAVRNRAGSGVAGMVVTAQRSDEPAFAPTAVTDAAGRFSVQVPPGGYLLRAPNGNSPAQIAVQVTSSLVRDLTLLDPPGAPTQVAAAGGNRQATVTWQRPADDGGADITSYTVTASPGGATCTSTTQSCTMQGLQNGQSYTFAVTAVNRIGTGPPSGASNPATVATAVPGPPRSVRASSSDRAVDVTWSASPSDDVVEYKATASPGGRSCSTAELACTIPGLRNGTAYVVAVVARSQAGSSTPVESRRVTPSSVPSAPRNLRIRPKPSGLRVAWGEPLDDGGRRVTGYVATAWPGGRTCHTAGALTCLIRGLDAATSYSVTVRAQNASGAGVSSPGSAPARPRSGPGALTRIRELRVTVREGQAKVRWSPVKRAQSYRVRLTQPGRKPGAWSVVTRPRASFAVTSGPQSVQVRASGPGGLGPVSKRSFQGR